MIAILNRAAGTAAKKAEELDVHIRQLFSERGIEVRIMHPDASRDLAALAREAVKSGDPVIVAGGGDGTINSVASALAGSEKTLGVLPLGTLNHFAKDLGIPLDLPAAVETIDFGHATQVDVAEVNDSVFINNSSLGIYPHIVARREAQQEHLGRGKWHAFAWAALGAFRRFPFLDLRIKIEGREMTQRTAFLFVGNNEYEISGFNLGARSCLNAGKLGLYLTRRTGRFGLFRLAFHALRGRLHQAEDFDRYCVEEAVIDAPPHRRLLVAIDGEVTWMETPLRYQVRPGALRVLVPQAKSQD